MRCLFLLILLICSVKLKSQDIVNWIGTTNNLTEGDSLEHTNVVVPAAVNILHGGNDGVGNVMLKVFDQNGIHLFGVATNLL